MYKANLSHKQLEKYLSSLLSDGLMTQIVEPDTGGRWYQVTEKGNEFLKDYIKLPSHFAEGNA